MKRHLSLLKILKEIYDHPGGDGEEILHRDLWPHIKNMPGTEQIQKWLDDKGSIPEYQIARRVTDPQSLQKLKSLIPQLKQQKLERFRNPQLQKDWNPYEEKEEEKKENGWRIPVNKNVIRSILRDKPRTFQEICDELKRLKTDFQDGDESMVYNIIKDLLKDTYISKSENDEGYFVYSFRD